MAFYSHNPFQQHFAPSPAYFDYQYQLAVQRERELARRREVERRAYEEELYRRRLRQQQLQRQRQEEEYLAALEEAAAEEEARASYYHPASPFDFFGHPQRRSSRRAAPPPRPVPTSAVRPPTPDSANDKPVEDGEPKDVVPVDETASTSSTPPAPISTPLQVADVSSPSSSASEHSDSDLDAAATTLQRHFRHHVRRREALSTLSSIADKLAAAQSSLVLPPLLAYQHKDKPVLAFSSTNAPFLAYEDQLVKLLSKIDEVQSAGDAVIKRSRKELVKRIEKELEKLDAKKLADWEKTRSGEDVSRVDTPSQATSAPLTSEALSAVDVVPHLTTDEETSSTSYGSTLNDDSRPLDLAKKVAGGVSPVVV